MSARGILDGLFGPPPTPERLAELEQLRVHYLALALECERHGFEEEYRLAKKTLKAIRRHAR
jgi:hypothetical protein